MFDSMYCQQQHNYSQIVNAFVKARPQHSGQGQGQCKKVTQDITQDIVQDRKQHGKRSDKYSYFIKISI